MFYVSYHSAGGWGLGAFLRWKPRSTTWAGPLIFFGHHQGCLNKTIFFRFGIMCCMLSAFHVSPWIVTKNNESIRFSSLNRPLGLAGEKYYQKITIPLCRLVLQSFALPGCFPYILFVCYFISLLLVGSLLQYATLYITIWTSLSAVWERPSNLSTRWLTIVLYSISCTGPCYNGFSMYICSILVASVVLKYMAYY